jgi:invasion protein IalB
MLRRPDALGQDDRGHATGADLKITVQDANKKPIDMSLPLLGFGVAFDKAK